jgi:hypothetical protein
MAALRAAYSLLGLNRDSHDANGEKW